LTRIVGNMTDDTYRQLSRRLDREWALLRTRPKVLRRVRSWGVTDAPFGSLDELLAHAGYRASPEMRRCSEPGLDNGPAGADCADEVLGRLLTLAPAEPLAARIVLQRILPGLFAIVRTEQRRDAGLDALDELVAEAWTAITRPRAVTLAPQVAARLLNEARHRAFAGPRRRRRISEVGDVEVDVTASAHSSSFDELVAVLVEARRHGLGAEHLVVIRGLLHHGTNRRVAAVTGVTTKTVYNRKRAAIAHIRRHALAA
jgi:hypothetical protein